MSRSGQGEPTYLNEGHVDRLLSGLLLVARELSVLQRRCDELEAALAGRAPEADGTATTSDLMRRLIEDLTGPAAEATDGR